jgi:hypothetical protein
MRKTGAAGRPRQAASPEPATQAPAPETKAPETKAPETKAAEADAVAPALDAEAVASDAEAVTLAAVVDPTGGGGRVAREPWAGWDPVIRVAGLVVSVVAAFLSGVLEVLLSPLRAGDLGMIWRGEAIGSGGGPPLGVSILLAVVANYGIAWFAVATTRRRWAMGLPWALWTLMMLFAAGVRTDEGDYLLAGNDWVALVMILVGSLTFAVYSYRIILKRPPN